MFILPTFDNLKIKRIPWATISLIVCCFWVYFVLQHNESDKLEKIIIEYGENGLLDMEAKAYTAFQLTKPEDERVSLPDRWKIEIDEEQSDDGKKSYGWLRYYYRLWQQIKGDIAFQDGLKNKTIITATSPEYEEWQYLHSKYQQDIKSVLRVAYSFTPAWPTWTTAFTSMFIHGNVYHLLGNMIFLFVAGMVLESVIGSVPFLVVYLLVGVLESWLTVPLMRDPAISCIGASGAISGIMGTYSIILGVTRIPAFLSLGFYFANLRLPAILLIVVWSLKEVIYFMLYPDSNVNYMAHFCGYLLGGAAGIPLRMWRGKDAALLIDTTDDERNQKVADQVSKGIVHLQNLEFEKARHRIKKAIEYKPGDVFLLNHLFAIDKEIEDLSNLKQTAEQLFPKLVDDKEQEHLLIRRYREYTEVAGTNLSAALLFKLARYFGRNEYFDEMMSIISELDSKHRDSEQFPCTLLLASRLLLNKGSYKRAMQCGVLLTKLFPDNVETRMVKSLFRSSKQQEEVAVG